MSSELCSEYRAAFIAALGVHALVFLWTGNRLLEPPKYEVDTGAKSLGVELVEHSPRPVEIPTLAPTLEPTAPPKKDDVIIPKPTPRPIVRTTPSAAPAGTAAPVSQGSSDAAAVRPTQGDSKELTNDGRGSGFISASPAYYRNPAPPYPREARERRVEGVVRLLVAVSAEGEPTNVLLKISSGSDLLDQAALEAVRRWHFKPAMMLGQMVSSQVEIPIRFKLEK